MVKIVFGCTAGYLFIQVFNEFSTTLQLCLLLLITRVLWLVWCIYERLRFISSSFRQFADYWLVSVFIDANCCYV